MVYLFYTNPISIDFAHVLVRVIQTIDTQLHLRYNYIVVTEMTIK